MTAIQFTTRNALVELTQVAPTRDVIEMNIVIRSLIPVHVSGPSIYAMGGFKTAEDLIRANVQRIVEDISLEIQQKGLGEPTIEIEQ